MPATRWRLWRQAQASLPLGDTGQLSHQEAMDKAETEYQRFAARRRAVLEAEGERDGLEALEAAAKRWERSKE